MALIIDDTYEVPNNPGAPTFDANPSVNLDQLTLDQLLNLRNEIERRLPVKNLREISLERELLLQHQASLELQNRVLADLDVPTNQKAQCLNSTAAVLAQVIKLQSEVHTTERLKRIENRLIEALNTLPAETQEAFLLVYAEILGAGD